MARSKVRNATGKAAIEWNKHFCIDKGTRAKAADERTLFDEDMRCDLQRVRACLVPLYQHLNRFDVKSTSLEPPEGIPYGTHFEESPYEECFHEESGEGDREEQPTSYSMLARGLYGPQLRLWHEPLVALRRDQLFVVDMQRTIDQPTDTFNRITNFYGLGDSQIDELPEGDSDHSGLNKVSCETRKELQDFFGGWNARLVEDLQTAYMEQTTPPAEPLFSGFAETHVDCE